MSYTNPNQTEAYTLEAGSTLLNSAIGLSKTETDVFYCKNLTAPAGAIVSGATICDGGSGLGNGTYSNIVISSGALLNPNGGVVSDVNIKSCGSLWAGGQKVTFYNMEADSGASLKVTVNGCIGGSKTTFSRGAFSGAPNIYAENGVIYNYGQLAVAFYFTDITLSNPNATGHYLYLAKGAVASGAAINAGTANKYFGLILVNSSGGVGSAVNTTATAEGAFITVWADQGECTFGGTQNNVAAGHIAIGAAGSPKVNNTLSIVGSNFNGLDLKNNTTKDYLINIKLIEGLNAKDAVVSSGGTLTLADGGSATNLTLKESGTVKVLAGGNIYETVVSGGAKLTVATNGYVDGLTVDNSVSAKETVVVNGRVDNLSMFGADIGASAVVLGQNAVVSGAVISGTRGRSVLVANQNAQANDIDVLNGNIYMYAGGLLTNLRQSGGEIITRASGAIVRSASVQGTGVLYVQNGASAFDVTVSNGGQLTVQMVTYGFIDNLNPTAGNVDILTGGTASVASGAILREVNISEGGKLTVASSGYVDGLTVDNSVVTKETVVANGRIDNLVMSGTNIGASAVVLGENAVVSGAVLSGTNGRSILVVNQGGSVNSVDVLNGNIYMYGEGEISNLRQSGGQVIARASHTVISNADVKNTGELYVQNGASAYDVTVSNGGTLNVQWVPYGYTDNLNPTAQRVDVLDGGTAKVASGTLRDVVLSSGGVVTVSSGGNVMGASAFGGKMTISASGYVSGLTIDNSVTAKETVVANGRIDDLVMSGTNIGASAVVLAQNAVLSGAIISGTYGRSVLVINQGGSANSVDVLNGNIYMYGDGEISNLRQSGGQVIARASHTVISNADVVSAGTLYLQNGASAYDVTVSNGGTLNVQWVTYGYTDNLNPTARRVNVLNGGNVSVASGALISADVDNGGVVNVSSGGMVSDLNTTAGARINLVVEKNIGTIQGADTNIAAGTLYFSGTALGASVENGVMKNLGMDGNRYSINVGTGITVEDGQVLDGWRISAFGNAVISGTTVTGTDDAASIVARDNAQAYNVKLIGGGKGKATLLTLWEEADAYDTDIQNGGTLRLNTVNNTASNTVVHSGGGIEIAAGTSQGGLLENTTLEAGAVLTLRTGVNTGNEMTLDFTGAGAGTTTRINDLSLVSSDTTVYVKGAEQAVGDYTLGLAGTLGQVTQTWGLYENAISASGNYEDALNGVTYSFNGTKITTSELAIRTGAAAGLAGDNYTALRTNDRAAKWTEAVDNATLVTEAFTGDAYLTVAGDAAKAIYGAAVNFGGTVNINAKSGTIRNLAAGAEAGKTVGAVKLTFDGATLAGAGYAGGFGSVTGETETLVSTGTFAKDFYGGALANKLTTATSVGDVSMTIDGGTFSGNIYGASAVKTDTTKGNGTRHTVDDVTLTITNGETTKGAQACIFAGGYATGDATGTVYTVDSVTATISGGSWGTAAGGRGVFGGIMASGVEAEVLGNVNITISGDATMGNVYGGGWAQKANGKSIVGDVNINIAGGTIANVFGGGSHSSSGGSTETGDITIIVSGGDITGAIYARGQLDGDTTGAASVIFTGAANFGCDVFGYSYVGGAASDAALSFNGYTGIFSGAVGGFNSITLDGATAMTLATAAADVSNGAWEFDFTDRADALAGTSLLTWGTADFENDTIKVSFANDAQAQGGWNIATVAEAFTGTTFEVKIGDSEIATGLAYNQQIASGDYAGWGFGLDEGVLKFKQLA